MLQISHLYADYGGKPALEDINLTLESGELLVVLGPSGCGKTTLLNLIAGFVPYQHGSIQLAGKGIQGPGAERGVVFQNEGLLPWRNVQDNVAFGLQLAGVEKMQRLEIAHQMLKKVGLEVNRPGFPGECFICELRLPDHRFRWKHNKLFLLLPEEYGPAFPA
ncbi:ATP-binding cassette domain-containing protein, partial [Escherichia coli]|nr:ATP-binding cassette domain-containing protein [Escherichia coli]MDF6406456.1 ATP-binding cassette domain-containing protein [Escherichia coli]MDF6416403.1 ATP-binding cassette domain-containing protein [Escherichia coli]MDF6656214.1 ATP-binding cassette domain-containing protein [Escherichia coli]MDF6714775.1 ATP-binding cassette domain-containing protein [Escherichia coli]